MLYYLCLVYIRPAMSLWHLYDAHFRAVSVWRPYDFIRFRGRRRVTVASMILFNSELYKKLKIVNP